MQLTLVIPELIWPETADGVLEGAACAALELLLTRSRRALRAPLSFEATLAEAFGHPAAPPYAALRLLGEPYAGNPPGDPVPDADDEGWLCCDPVHLRFHQQHVVLADGGGLAIAVDEARELGAELNRQLPELGQLHLASADRWYLKLADPALAEGLDALPRSQVAGRRVDHLLAASTASSALRSRLLEAQMVLHAHPANQRREARGEPPINSLWLWGGGTLAQRDDAGAPPSRFDAVWSDDPLALGLARHAGVMRRRRPAAASVLLDEAARDSHHLVILDALPVAVAYEDGDAYRRLLAELDAQWFAPLRAALAAGHLRQLAIEAPTAYAGASWHATRTGQWRFWLRAQPLAAQARALADAGLRPA